MKKVFVILFSMVCFQLSFAQTDKFFNLTDSKFEVGQLFVEDRLYFTFDKIQLFPECMIYVDSIAQFLNKHKKLVVEVSNHTDIRGSSEYNENLSQRRAQLVVDSLIVRGVSKERLIAKGYGESKPRELEKDIKGITSGYIFKKGTVLTEEYLKQFDIGSHTHEQDIYGDGHNLNRRIEVKIISIQ